MTFVSRVCFALLLTASAAAVAAGAADSVQAVDPYVRLSPPGARATAAFMTLKNGGSADIKFVKAESLAAKNVELHRHVDKAGVMEMRPVGAIDIKAKGETALRPGGYHIMMIDPLAMKEGDKVIITLHFADGSSKRIEAPVKRPEAAPMPMDPASHDHRH